MREFQVRTVLFLALFFAGVGFAGLMGAYDHETAQNVGNYVAGMGVGGFLWGRGPTPMTITRELDRWRNG